MASEAELVRRLTAGATWWRNPAGWERDDPDLAGVAQARFVYEPEPLKDLAAEGLYTLLGPRRVGKSVEMKRAIRGLIETGVDARRILHFACDGLANDELIRLVRGGRQQATRAVEGSRYWFLDEITGAKPGWPDTIKWLRDNDAGFRRDCVVLSGSSARDLQDARKAFAGRRGGVADSERLLLPMSFRAFCAAVGFGMPTVPPIPAHRFLDRSTETVIAELTPWLDDFINAWELYLTIGGFPRAINAYLETGAVDRTFFNDLWSVVDGELRRRSRDFSATQANALLAGLVSRLTKPVNLRTLAKQLGVATHDTAQKRILELETSYLAWRCYPEKDGLPHAGAQYKVYFADPLLARLVHQLNVEAPDPTVSDLTEQQLGYTLVRQWEAEHPGDYSTFGTVMSTRTSTNQEIDFVGPVLDGVGFEGKYVDEKIDSESRTLRAQVESGALTDGVLATRALIDLDSYPRVWAVSAPMLVWLLES